MMTQRTHSARLTPELHRRLAIVAAVEGTTVQAILEKIVTDGVEVYEAAEGREVATEVAIPEQRRRSSRR